MPCSASVSKAMSEKVFETSVCLLSFEGLAKVGSESPGLWVASNAVLRAGAVSVEKTYCCRHGGELPIFRRALKVVTWLILPVVICLSQRLSHACLSISNLYSETANGSLNQL
jgi:putative hemolysin